MTIHSLSQRTWRSQLRVVMAIAWKDWLHFVRYPLNAVFRVLQPIIWLTPVYFLGRSFQTAEGNVGFAAYTGTSDYMSFILLGAMLTSFIGAIFWGIGYSLKSQMDSGVLESNWLAPVPRMGFLVGQTVASLAVTTVVNIGILLLGWLFFGFRVDGNVLKALAVALPMLLALYGFGFGFAALVLILRDANTLVDVSDFLVSGLSGTQFPVRALPSFLAPLALALPLTYGLDAVRGLLIHTTPLLPISLEIAILLLFLVVTLPLGSLVFRLVEQRCKQLGTIGMH